jgi:hypothetical protein
MSGRLAAFIKRASVAQKSGSPFATRGAQAKVTVQANKSSRLANSSFRTNTLSNPSIAEVNESIKQSFHKSRAVIAERVVAMKQFGYEQLANLNRLDLLSFQILARIGKSDN